VTVRLALLTTCLAACATLSGLDDKKADLEDGIGAPGRPSSDGGEGASSSTSSSSSGSGATDADADANPPLVLPDGSTSGPRKITFEDGKLVHPTTGFDSTIGATQLLSTNALDGTYSMLVDGTAAYGTVSFAPATDLYLTLRFRIDPATIGATGDARILRITHGGGAVIEATLAAGPRDLALIQGASSLGRFNDLLSDGTIYRLELALRSTGAVSFRLITGASTGSVGGTATVSAFSKVEVGTLGGGTTRVSFDDIFIDTATLP
jgi:hypothetical protein